MRETAGGRRHGQQTIAVLTIATILSGCAGAEAQNEMRTRTQKAREAAVTGDGLNVEAIPAKYRRYADYIRSAGTACADVTPALVAGLIDVETGWNPRTSGDGAQGLGQFMPATWQGAGRDGDKDGKKDVNNPADAIIATGDYLCYIAKKVKEYHKDGKIPNVRPGEQLKMPNLMLIGYLAGPYVWTSTKYSFTPQGEPIINDANDMMPADYANLIIERANETYAARDSSAPAGPPVNQNQMFLRARTWADAKVPYSQVAKRDGYRQDCSGYVSMILGLSKAGGGPNTRTMMGLTTQIRKNQMRPGDLVLDGDPGSAGHVVLFEGWADPMMTHYFGWEQTPSGIGRHRIPWPYHPFRGVFEPRRLK